MTDTPPPTPPTPPPPPDPTPPSGQSTDPIAPDAQTASAVPDPLTAPTDAQTASPTPELTPAPVAPAPPPARPSRWSAFRTGLSKAVGHSDQLTTEQQITRRSFVSFSAFAILGVAAWKSWFWLKDSAQSNGVQSPLRKGLDIDDKVFKHTLSSDHLAKTYPLSAAAKNVRYNSGIGLLHTSDDLAAWRLQVTTLDNRILSLTIDDLRRLPKTEYAFEFKCIEGWSQVSWWGGVKFSDFVNYYKLQKELTLAYVGLSTPDDHYYVGIDTPSALHPQTLLCYEMNGQPLPARHGAPLRLIIPVKYGVKNLKCISKIHFSNDRPRDYWFERGYDYYCGL